MNEIPVVAAVRRYLSEAVSGRDFGVLAEILVPDYRFDGDGTPVIGRDDTYIPMVSGYLTGEPTIDTAVHAIVTDGRHAAVWLTKFTGEPRAAWEAVLIYRARGELLERCWSEQDWATRRRQLKGQQAPPARPIESAGVWNTSAATGDPAAEAVARDWLINHPGDLTAAAPGAAPPTLDDPEVTVNCLFTAGNRFAFHLTHRGIHRDGASGSGHPAELNAAGLGEVTDGVVTCTRVITDASAMRHRLAAGLVPAAGS